MKKSHPDPIQERFNILNDQIKELTDELNSRNELLEKTRSYVDTVELQNKTFETECVVLKEKLLDKDFTIKSLRQTIKSANDDIIEIEKEKEGLQKDIDHLKFGIHWSYANNAKHYHPDQEVRFEFIVNTKIFDYYERTERIELFKKECHRFLDEFLHQIERKEYNS